MIHVFTNIDEIVPKYQTVDPLPHCFNPYTHTDAPKWYM